MTATVLVTGAGGFIGSVVAGRLQDAGYQVRRGMRHAQAGGTACDLDRPDEVRAAVRGTDLVVHCAYGASGAMAAQCDTLLEAMTAAGVARLIHFSSIAVHGDATGDLVEQPEGLVPADAYGAAKVACEDLVHQWAGTGSHALILRPGIVYGAASPFWIVKLSARIRAGAWGTFGDEGEGTAALVHVDDVADLVVLAAARMLAPDGDDLPATLVAHVVGPETPSWNRYFAALAAALAAPPLRELSAGVVRLRQMLAVPAKVWRKLGLPGGECASLAPTPGEMALFRRKARYQVDSAREFFGFTPRVGLDEGLRRSVDQPKS